MNFKIWKIFIAAASFMFFSSAGIPLLAEAVFLKDGSIINGTIVSDGSTSIRLQLTDKKVKQITRSDILRIVYTELKMGKLYIQMRDGKGIVAFLVDEDRASYTFRKELYNPEEFILKRSDVLFLAEKNPSGLQVNGNIGTDRVLLTWLPPYDSVKKYNLYTKKSEKDKYELAESTGSKSITLKNLSSNTTYFIIVTSVDTDGYESSPSNELKLKTSNIPPTEPSEIKRDLKNGKITVSWKEAKDPDGKVKEYNIYNRDNKEKVKIATVKKAEYTVPDNVSVYKLEIASVDDLDAESDRVRVQMPMKLAISAAPAGFSFSGKLGDMFNPGYGGTLNIGLRDFMFQNFEAGINAGYFALSGKEKMNTDSMKLVPVTAYAGYHLRIGEWFSFFPFAKAGALYSKVKYTSLSAAKGKTIIDPAGSLGLALTAGSNNFTFSIGGDYGTVYESAGMKPFYEFFISCGTLFEL